MDPRNKSAGDGKGESASSFSGRLLRGEEAGRRERRPRGELGAVALRIRIASAPIEFGQYAIEIAERRAADDIAQAELLAVKEIGPGHRLVDQRESGLDFLHLPR